MKQMSIHQLFDKGYTHDYHFITIINLLIIALKWSIFLQCVCHTYHMAVIIGRTPVDPENVKLF